MNDLSLKASLVKGRFNALVLAGTRRGKEDPVAVHAGLPHKTLVPIAGKPMLNRVVESIKSLPYIDTVTICAESHTLLEQTNLTDCDFITAQAGPSASVIAGLHRLGTPLLITTADHALLRAEWVTEFILAQSEKPTDISAAITSKEAILRDVPLPNQRTYLKFSDGSFSGCNLFLMNTPRALDVARLWQRLEAERKHPIRMARILGWRVLAAYIMRRLSREKFCRAITRLTGASAQLVTLSSGMAAVDVDRPADIELVTSLLKMHPI